MFFINLITIFFQYLFFFGLAEIFIPHFVEKLIIFFSILGFLLVLLQPKKRKKIKIKNEN